MADDADRAEQREAEIRADALAAHMRRTQTTTPSLESCEECDEGIPLQRRIAVPGVRLCIHCQTRQEHQHKGLAGR